MGDACCLSDARVCRYMMPPLFIMMTRRYHYVLLFDSADGARCCSLRAACHDHWGYAITLTLPCRHAVIATLFFDSCRRYRLFRVGNAAPVYADDAAIYLRRLPPLRLIRCRRCRERHMSMMSERTGIASRLAWECCHGHYADVTR